MRDRRDRTVHATGEGVELVRYDVSGKWYAENADGSRRQITLGDATKTAIGLAAAGGTIHFDKPGGMMFDAKVRRLQGVK